VATSTSTRAAHRARVRRRRLTALLGLVLLLAGGATAALLLTREEPPAVAAPVASQTAIEQAAAQAASQAAEGAAAVEEVEERAWALGPYVDDVAATDAIRSVQTDEPIVALTFDDGPGAQTYDILAILDRYDAPATFFVLGYLAEADSAPIQQALADGHVIANHTWTHEAMPDQTNAQIIDELNGTSDVIRSIADRRPTLFRPPYGAYTGRTNRQTRRTGMVPVLWNVDSADWRATSSKEIVDNVLNADGLGPGAIILFHDKNGNGNDTINALPRILDGLAARGLKPVTLTELLRAGPAVTVGPGDFGASPNP
jgi:peptidoglycan/xylan/chitin deacetylase (PgdA/CDA1 family)